jgi:hypothetical protein
MNRFWVILGVSIVTSWLVSRARRARAHKVGGAWLFPPINAVKGVFFLGGLMGLGLAVLCIHAYKQEPEALWGAIGCVIWVALCAGSFPKSVWLSESGIRQRTWYGRWKAIGWERISEIKLRTWDGSNCLVIRGDRMKINFSSTHAGREFFMEEVGRRTHLMPKISGRVHFP